MALPIVNLHVNVNPLASFALLQAANSNRKASDPKSVVGDRSRFRVWFWDIEPGSSSGTTVRQNDLNFTLVGKKSPWTDEDPYLLGSEDFTEGGNGDDGWYYETVLGFDDDLLVTAVDEANGEITLKIDIERQNLTNTERLTSQFDWKVRKQVNSGGALPSGEGVPSYPTFPTADTVLAGSSDGLSWVKLTFAQLWAKFIANAALLFPISRLDGSGAKGREILAAANQAVVAAALPASSATPGLVKCASDTAAPEFPMVRQFVFSETGSPFDVYAGPGLPDGGGFWMEQGYGYYQAGFVVINYPDQDWYFQWVGNSTSGAVDTIFLGGIETRGVLIQASSSADSAGAKSLSGGSIPTNSRLTSFAWIGSFTGTDQPVIVESLPTMPNIVTFDLSGHPVQDADDFFIKFRAAATTPASVPGKVVTIVGTPSAASAAERASLVADNWTLIHD